MNELFQSESDKKKQINLEKEFLIDLKILLQLVEVDKRNTVNLGDTNWEKT